MEHLERLGNQLYLNDGNGMFNRSTLKAAQRIQGTAWDLLTGDYDGDGFSRSLCNECRAETDFSATLGDGKFIR